jgi:hypothetical protein
MVKNSLAPQKKSYGAPMAQMAQKSLRHSRKSPIVKLLWRKRHSSACAMAQLAAD